MDTKNWIVVFVSRFLLNLASIRPSSVWSVHLGRGVSYLPQTCLE